MAPCPKALQDKPATSPSSLTSQASHKQALRHLLSIYCPKWGGASCLSLKGPEAGRQQALWEVCTCGGGDRPALWGYQLQGGAQAHPVPTLCGYTTRKARWKTQAVSQQKPKTSPEMEE